MERNLRGRALVRPIVGAATAMAIISFVLPTAAYAGEELLVRKTIRFEECKSRVLSVPASLGALPERVSVVRDTGAEFQLKIAAQKANLVMGCNKVSDQMEVYRTTPGEAPQTTSVDLASSSSG